ncbi:MAG: PAS domain S-box protein [Nitrospirae bacterium]|nr:PAS domain S-box protein [Nitrospirota bacterium]
MLLSIVAVVSLPIFTELYVYPAFSRYQMKETEEHALHISNHIAGMFGIDNLPIDYASSDFVNEINNARKNFNLFKIKVFTPDGRLVYSTENGEIGDINEHPYFYDIVLKGNIYSKEAEKDTKSLDGNIIPIDVFETYIPVIKDGKVAIIFETYLDNSASKAAFNKIISDISKAMSIVSLLLFGAVMFSSFKARRSMKERESAVKELMKYRDNLEIEVKERTAKLEDEKAKTEGILAGMGEAVSMQNLDFKVLYQNKAHIDLVGYHFGEYCYKAYQKKDKVCETCHLAMAFKDGRIHTAKQSRVTDNGEIHYEIVASPLKDSSGKIIAGIEMVREVTENVQRERMLSEQASIALLRADIGIALTYGGTLKEILQRCCESAATRLDVAFARIWSLNREDNLLELQASAGMYTHLDGEHSRIPVGKFKIGMIAKEKLPHITNNVIGDSGLNDQKWAKREGIRAFAGYPLIVGEDVVGVLGVFSRNMISDTVVEALGSISSKIALGIDRKLAVLELTRSENDLRNLFESVNDAVFVLDMNGNFIDANTAAYKRLGYTKDEMLSMHISELDTPEFAAKVPERFEQIAKHGKAIFESAHLRKDGTVMPVEVNSVLTIFKGREVLLSTIRDITQRKQIENELFRSRVEWEETFNNITDMITIHDHDFNIIQANKAALDMLNLPDSVPGKQLKCYQYYHGTSFPPEKCVSCECLTTGKPATFEMYEPAFDKHVEVRAMPRFDLKGEIIGVSHIVRDISYRKSAEKALENAHDLLEERVSERTRALQRTNEQLLSEISERLQLQRKLQESERRYRRFFEDSPTSLWEIDFSGIKTYIEKLKEAGVTDFRNYFYNRPDEVMRCAALIKVTDVNITTLEIYKARSKKDFLANLDKVFCEETFDLFRHEFIAVAEENFELETEGITRNLNGEKIHISIKWSVQSGAEKTLSKILVSVVDITERKKAEEALIENEKRLRAITDSTTDLIWEGDTRYNVLNWFGNIDAILGYDPGEFPRTISGHMESIHPKDRDKVAESIETAIRTQKDIFAQYSIKCKDGTYRVWEERGRAVGFEDGKAVKWVGSITDITEKVRMEEQQKFMQAKLLHTNKMTALGTLVSGVAHEINNPNAFIMTNAELLSMIWKDVNSLLSVHYKKDKDLSLGGLPYSELRNAMPQLLKGISEGSGRIKSIIDNLKNFSRPDKTNLDEDVDINEAIRNSLLILGQQITKYTIHFSTHYMKNLPLIKGNRQNFEQVIINLLSNALQALPDKECGVRVSTLHNKKDNLIVVTIKDEGAGIPAEIMDRITEPFFTTKIDTGGTGLGLYISYAIINDHKGSMKFESVEGKGTTVSIYLPTSHL